MRNGHEEVRRRNVEPLSNRYQLELADNVEKKNQRVNAGLKTVQQNGGAEVTVINGIIDGDCEEELPSGPRVLKHITPASLYDPSNPATMPLDGVHTKVLDSGSVILDVAKMDTSTRTPTNDVGARALVEVLQDRMTTKELQDQMDLSGLSHTNWSDIYRA